MRKYWGITYTLCFLATTLIYLLMVEDRIYIQIHDNLDYGIAQLKMMKDYGLFWSFGTTMPILGGVSRDYMYSDLKLFSWIYMIFSPFVAFAVCWYLRIILAITGFVLLGKEIYGDWKNINYFIACGLMYGILPMYPLGGIGFASVPLFCYILMRLKRNFDFKYMVGIFLFPLLSDFVFWGIFMCMVTFGVFILNFIKDKKIEWQWLLACIILSVGFVVTEWRLFYVILFIHEESIRSTFVIDHVGALGLMKEIAKAFLLGHYHSGSAHTLIVLPTIMYGWYCFYKKDFISRKKLLNWVIITQIFCCVVYGIDKTEWFRNVIGMIIPLLRGFQWGRTLWFAPFLWYIAFMLVVCEAKWQEKYKKSIVILALIAICVCPGRYNDILTNVKNQVKSICGMQVNDLNYREFFAEDLFSEIKKQIDYNGEWSIAYGFHPAVLEYNGIATLDGYLSCYKKSYKDEFRQLIEPELSLDKKKEKYFDSWGARAYVFSLDLGYDPVKKLSVNESRLYIDIDSFHRMGGEYIFSRVKITNAEELGLTELNVFEKNAYTIFVYK